MNASELFDGQVVLVTGGGRGLGAEIARAFSKQKATVVLTGRNIEPLTAVANEIADGGGTAMVIEMDIARNESVESGARQILNKFGRVDVLINNAAIGGPAAPLWKLDLEQWQETIDVNVTGAFHCCRYFLPSMIENKKGAVVFIGSMSGKRPLENRSAYTTSKMALVGLARTLAWEVGRYGIRVNVVSPGPIEGDRLNWVFENQAQHEGITVEQARDRMMSFSPLASFAKLEDVADMTVFLSSDKCGATTGEDINVSSGIAMY